MVEEVVAGIKMSINIPVKVRIELSKKFEWAYKKSIEMSVKHIVKSCKNEIPVKTEKTREALDYTIDYNTGEAIIGWKNGSREQLVGNVLHYGSGERGRDTPLQHSGTFGDKKPDYTVPIVPTHSKAMKFIGRDGKWKSMKVFKGHYPKEVLTRGLIKSMRFLPIVIDNEMNKK